MSDLHVSAMRGNLLSQLRVPRRDGKLFFTSGWQCRTLVISMLLQEKGLLEVTELSHWLRNDSTVDPTDPDVYYAELLREISACLGSAGIVKPQELSALIVEATEDHASHKRSSPKQ